MRNLNATTGSKLVSGPVRAIGVQSRSITGTMPDGNRYESALERDFMLLVRFDTSIDVYTPQPLTLEYRSSDGQSHRYTPDGLIEWRADRPIHDPRPLLVEIKYREAFKGEWRVWKARAKATNQYANERGWAFKIYTEREIRTPFLDNVRFLLPYLRRSSLFEIEQSILDRLSELGESNPRDLMDSLYLDKWNQAARIPVLWKLLAERYIGCDLTQPLTMQSDLWSIRG